MVKEIVLDIEVPSCTVQTYHDAIYKEPQVFQQYHRDINKCETAEVTAWENGQRTVTFGLALTIPLVVKKIVGVEEFTVRETQELEWQDDRSFIVTSQPLLDFPGSSKFVTGATFKVEQTSSGSCKVVATISCTAGMPWPMQSTVEAIMADQARITVGQFMDYCKQYMRDHLARQQAGAKAASAGVPLSSIAAGVLVTAGDLEDYCDAGGTQSPMSAYSALSEFSIRSSSAVQGGEASPVALPPLLRRPPPAESFEEAVLQYLGRLSQQQDGHSRTIEQLHASIQQLGQQVQQLVKVQAQARSKAGDSFAWYSAIAMASAASTIAYFYWRRSHK